MTLRDGAVSVVSSLPECARQGWMIGRQCRNHTAERGVQGHMKQLSGKWFGTRAGRWLGVFAVTALALTGAVVGSAVSKADDQSHAVVPKPLYGPLPDASDPHAAAALLEADRIAAAFAAPPGARRSARRPANAPGIFVHPQPSQGDPDLAQSITWYTTSLSPKTALSWVATHPSAGSQVFGNLSDPAFPPALVEFSYTEPSVSPLVLARRSVEVAAEPGTDGHTVIRVTVDVVWSVTKPADAHIPAGVTAVTITAARQPSFETSATLPPLPLPVTTTNPSTVRQISDLIDVLVPKGPAVHSCPVGLGALITLTFRDGAGGPIAATVVAEPDSCGWVTLTVGAKQMPILLGGQGLAKEAYSLLGVAWTEQ
jgi:hypothetical protein